MSKSTSKFKEDAGIVLLQYCIICKQKHHGYMFNTGFICFRCINKYTLYRLK